MINIYGVINSMQLTSNGVNFAHSMFFMNNQDRSYTTYSVFCRMSMQFAQKQKRFFNILGIIVAKKQRNSYT